MGWRRSTWGGMHFGYNQAHDEHDAVLLSRMVLGAYCVFVVTHVFLLVFTGHTGPSWDSISELLMLGLMSRKAGHLGLHASVGIETLNTLREPVSVKVDDEGLVDLVSEKDVGGKVGGMVSCWLPGNRVHRRCHCSFIYIDISETLLAASSTPPCTSTIPSAKSSNLLLQCNPSVDTAHCCWILLP